MGRAHRRPAHFCDTLFTRRATSAVLLQSSNSKRAARKCVCAVTRSLLARARVCVLGGRWCFFWTNAVFLLKSEESAWVAQPGKKSAYKFCRSASGLSKPLRRKEREQQSFKRAKRKQRVHPGQPTHHMYAPAAHLHVVLYTHLRALLMTGAEPL
jgi:hypothetical protein